MTVFATVLVFALFIGSCFYIWDDIQACGDDAQADELGAQVLLLETLRADGGPGRTGSADSETGATTTTGEAR